MRYELMLPHQIRTAIAENWPVVLPLGVLEYHGEHMAVGMDTLAVIKMLELVEQEMDLVILPPFYYGAASYAVEPPEGNGSVQVDGGALAPFAEALFFSLLRIGFRNIHAIIHHQTENFAAGMPTDLAFKSAGRQAIFRFIESESGEGWWGNEKMADLLCRARGRQQSVQLGAGASADDARDHWPTIRSTMPAQGETSLMMALCPEAVDMERFADNKGWYTASAKDASAELGGKGRDMILAHSGC